MPIRTDRYGNSVWIPNEASEENEMQRIRHSEQRHEMRNVNLPPIPRRYQAVTSTRPEENGPLNGLFANANATVTVGGNAPGNMVIGSVDVLVDQDFNSLNWESLHTHTEPQKKKSVAKQKEIEPVEQRPVDEKEELIVNLEELADYYATEEFERRYPKVSIGDKCEIYMQLVEKHKKTILKYKRGKNEW